MWRRLAGEGLWAFSAVHKLWQLAHCFRSQAERAWSLTHWFRSHIVDTSHISGWVARLTPIRALSDGAGVLHSGQTVSKDSCLYAEALAFSVAREKVPSTARFTPASQPPVARLQLSCRRAVHSTSPPGNQFSVQIFPSVTST